MAQGEVAHLVFILGVGQGNKLVITRLFFKCVCVYTEKTLQDFVHILKRRGLPKQNDLGEHIEAGRSRVAATCLSCQASPRITMCTYVAAESVGESDQKL